MGVLVACGGSDRELAELRAELEDVKEQLKDEQSESIKEAGETSENVPDEPVRQMEETESTETHEGPPNETQGSENTETTPEETPDELEDVTSNTENQSSENTPAPTPRPQPTPTPTPTPIPTPEAPRNLQIFAGEDGSGELGLQWVPPLNGPSPTGYLVKWREYGSNNWSEGIASNNSALISGLTNNTNYEFQIFW